MSGCRMGRNVFQSCYPSFLPRLSDTIGQPTTLSHRRKLYVNFCLFFNLYRHVRWSFNTHVPTNIPTRRSILYRVTLHFMGSLIDEATFIFVGEQRDIPSNGQVTFSL